MFAAILGLHMLCDTLVFREGSFEMFLGRFAHYVRLHSGVRTIAAEGRWDDICEFATKLFTKFSPQLGPTDAVPGPVCKALIERVMDSESDEAAQKALLQAIQALQSVMIALEKDPSTRGAVNALIAWPLLVPREYVDFISAHKPEALVILAYYGGLIHSYRDRWMFCDGGLYLVESVNQHIAADKKDWLQWPLSRLAKAASRS
jgi:hypothetical protein